MRPERLKNPRWLAIATVGLALACTVACTARFARSNPSHHVAATALETPGPASSNGPVAQPPQSLPRPVMVPRERAIEAQERDDDHEAAERDDRHEADRDDDGDDDDDEKHEPGADSPDDALEFRRLQQQDENGDIPFDGLTRAKKQVDAMRAFQSAMGAIADFLGFDAPPGAGIGSATWTWLGPGNIGGRLRSIVVNPVLPSTWFAGSVSGGIWKTIDSGAHWEVVNDFLANLSVSTMVMQPDNPMVMYAGTGEYYQALQGAGIFKSTDGGSTWTLLSSTATDQAYHYVNRLAISSNGAVLLAATWLGIYRSIDGGATFNLVLNTFSNPDFDNPTYVAFNPADNSKAVASAYDGRAWYSTNSGMTWNVASGIPAVPGGSRRVELAYAPGNPSIVYASVDQSGGTIYKSTDGGVTYSFVSTGTNYLGTQGWYDNTLWVDPANPNTLVIGGISLYKSVDGGLTLTNINGIVHADKHTIVSMPGYNGTTNRQVLVGSDGGIHFVNDIYAAPSGWTSKNNNLGVTQFYGAAGNATSGTIVGGTQDNGTLRYTTAGGPQAHTSMAGGDGGYAASDPTDPNVFYGEFQRLGVHRSTNGGASSTLFFNSAIPDYNGNSNFIAPFVLDPNDPHTLVAGGASLWRTNNAKFGNPPTFTSIKSPIGTFISAIAIAPGNSNICWVGYNNGNVYRSTDCTALSPSWLQVDNGSAPLPNRMVMRLTIDPTDPTGNRVYATFGGFSPANIWRTTNSGTSWSSASGSGAAAIPSVPVHDLDVLPGNPNWLYAATEIGVFTSQDFGVSWQIPQDGPANVVVSELFWMGPDLVAATFGRGLYKTQAAGQTPGTLTGVIRDATTNGGIVGATVSLSPGGVSTVSGVTGAYTLTIPPGSYTVTVAASGKGTATFSGVLVTGGVTTTRDFAIGPQGTLTGHVRDATTNAGIANATVSATPGGVTVTTDATGLYTANLAAGTYSVRAMTSTRPQVSVPGVVVTYGATTTQDFVLQAGALQQSQGPNFGTFSIGRIEIPLTATGGDDTYVWTIVAGALPPGLALRTDNPTSFPVNASGGLVGIATTPGIYNFALRVTSGAQILDQACTLKVTALAIKDGNHFDYLPEAFAGAFYSYALTPLNNAGAVSWTATGVPAGMSLSASGVLSGTPASQGFASLNLSLSDGIDTVSRSLFLPIYAINVTPGLLPNATLGAAYTATLTATGGTPPYTFSGCCPPGGLTLSSTGTISGTVSSFSPIGPMGFFVTVTDSINNSYSKYVSIDVLGAPVLPALRQYGTFDDCTFGVTCSRGIAVTNGGTAPFAWTASGLPPGMSIRSATGGRNYVSAGPGWGYQQAAGDAELWGVPTQIGTFNIQVTATDIAGVATTQVFPLKVSHLGQPTANAFAPVINSPFSRTIRVLGGTLPYAAIVVNGSLPAGMTFDGLSLLLSGTPLENGFFNPVFQFTDAAARSVRLTENISVGGTPTPVFINDGGDLGQTPHNASYSRQLSACCAGSFVWSLVSGALPPGVTLSSTGLLSGVANTSGTYTFLIKATDPANSASFGARQFTLRVTTISINGNFTLPNGNVGASYTNVFGATGGSGALTWTVAPFSYLPPGLTLSSGGVLSGTPTATGQFFFTIRATDPSLNIAERQFGVSIFPAVSPPVVQSQGPNFGTWSVGQLETSLSATGGNGTYVWSVIAGALPPGMSLRTDRPPFFPATASAGLIGVATTVGTYNFTLRVTSGGQTADQACTIKIVTLASVESPLPDAFVGTPFSYQLHAQGNAGPVIWMATSALPQGLSLSSTGLLSGIPTASGFANVSFSINDGVNTVFRGVNFTVYAVAITNAGVLPNATQNTPYNVAIVATGGAGGFTFSASNLPPGLSINQSTGVISGTVTSNPGKFNIQVTVRDLNGTSYTKSLAISVIGVPPALPSIVPYGRIGVIDDCTIGIPCHRGVGVFSGGAPPFSWTASGLPPGMAIRSANGATLWWVTPGDVELWGVPTATGTYNVQLVVTDGDGKSATNTFPLKVSTIFQTAYMGDGTLDVPYATTVRTIGGTGSYTVVQTKGVMPAGLAINPGGGGSFGVSGTPTESGAFYPQLTFTDGASATVSATNNFNISGAGSGALSIGTNSDLGSTTLGTGFSRTLSACCAATIVWSHAGGSLPPGMALTPGGVLTGTPSAVGLYTFVIKATDAADPSTYAARRFTLYVTTINITTGGTLPFGNVNVAYSQTLVATGGIGSLSWVLAPNTNSFLPPGLTLSTSGVVAGTPTVTGQFNFTVLVSDGFQSATRTFNLSIYCAACTPPLALNVGPNFTVPVGRFTVQLGATGGAPPYHYSLTPGASVIPGMRVQDGAPLPLAFAANTTAGYIGVITTPGTYNTSLRVTDSTNTTFDRAITVTVLGFNIVSQATPPNAIVNTPYSFAAMAYPAAGPYGWSASGLPPGLAMSGAGVISGLPTTAGRYFGTVTLTDLVTSRSVSQGISLTVDPFAVTTLAGGSVLPSGMVGATYNAVLSAPNCGFGGCGWSAVGTLPSGLSLFANGVIAGVPTATFSGSVTVAATGLNGSVQKTLGLVIASNSPSPLQITMGSTFTSTIGTGPLILLSASGGTAPYNWSLTSGSLPPGITLQGPGENLGALLTPGFMYLAGRPMVVGTYTFTLAVTDAVNVTATRTFTWNSAHHGIDYLALPLAGTTLICNAPYSQPLLALGGTPPYTWTATGTMPAGLTLSTAGIVSGTPTVAGFFSTSVQVRSSESGLAFPFNLSFTITGGRIRGKVTNASTNTGLGAVSIQIYDTTGRFVASTSSDASGNYTSSELASGTYFARTENTFGFIDQAYNGVPCPPCSEQTATPIAVMAPNSTDNINFALTTGGRISGRVTKSANGEALSNVEVDIYEANGNWVTYGFSDASGNYTSAAGLPTGIYFARTFNAGGFVDEVYNNITCVACSPTTGTPIAVTAPAATSGINFALDIGGRISGKVIRAAGGAALANIEVDIYGANNQWLTYGFSDASGNYTTTAGLPAGNYYAATWNSDGYINKLYQNIDCVGCAPSAGTPIAVTPGGITPNINFALSLGGRISGIVTAAATGTALSAVAVEIFNSAGIPVTNGFSDASGNYVSFGGLTSATYFARTANTGAYQPQLYDNIACPNCSVTTGTPIAVTSPSTASGINFALVTTASIPTLTIGDGSVTEGNSGTTNLVFTVTMTPASTQTVTVFYATEDGDATAGSDYIAASGTLMFAPGETMKLIIVAVKGDTIKESDEKFALRLGSPNGALIGDGLAYGTILNDDNASLSVTPARVAGGGSVTATFTGGPGNPGDWWGVYLIGAPDTDYKSWGYLNGLHTMPATGLTDATLPIAMPDVAGTYEIRWWQNNSLQLIVRSDPVVVATVLVTPLTVKTSESVTATFTNGPGNPADWWGVYLVGAADNDYKSWGYMNGLQTAPNPGLPNATLSIAMPTTSGTYEIRWWESGGQKLIAKSVPIVVVPATQLSVSPTTVNAGGTVTATLTGGPGNRGDWCAVYRVGDPDVSYLTWFYLNGQHTMPATGLTDATLPIRMPNLPGMYRLRCFVNNTLTPLVTSDQITVIPAADPATVDVTPTTVDAGGNVTATFAHGPGNSGDWWGVYLVGAPDVDYKSWGYLNGEHTLPLSGLTDATLPIAMPGVAGTYEIRWWENNRLQPIAKSGPITVRSAAKVTATPSRVGGGDTVSATFANGPGNPGDWWGVYLVDTPDTAYLSWGYLNGLHTMPATGLTDATLPIALPNVAGTYEIRWWLNNGLQPIAKSGPIEVATVTLAPTTVNVGGSVTATFTNGPANPGDWWGVYLVGSPDTAYLSWGYMNGLHTMPSPGVPGATLPISMPGMPGIYEIRWWLNNGLQPIAKSEPITVTSAATVTATPTSVAAGESVSVTFAGGPGNPGDWWGVYLVDAPDVDYKSWGYLNGLHTTPASGLTDAMLSIAMPNVPGTYEVRWWANNGLQLIAKSGPITVVSSRIEAVERLVPLPRQVADAVARFEFVDER